MECYYKIYLHLVLKIALLTLLHLIEYKIGDCLGKIIC